MRRTPVALALVATTAAAGALLAAPAHAAPGGPSKSLVIARVFGGGGNAGAYYPNDFVELYNPTAAAVPLAGWSLQYASSGGSIDATKTVALTGSVAPGRYFLFVGNNNGGTVPGTLPTADQSNNAYAISSTSSTVFLVDQPAASAVSTIASATDPAIVDEVGIGTAVDYETKAAAVISNTTWTTRTNNLDTDNNATDFATQAADGSVAPRNSATTTSPAPTLPEAPLAVGLPLVAAAAGGAVVLRRRRRTA